MIPLFWRYSQTRNNVFPFLFLILTTVFTYLTFKESLYALTGVFIFSFLTYIETVTQLSFRAPQRRKPVLEEDGWETLAHPTLAGSVNSYIHEASSKKAPTLILIHGWTSASSRMVGRSKVFIDRDWAVIAVDLPNHGGSDSVDKWTAERATSTVIESLNHISRSHPHLFSSGVCYYGHSMGGFIGLRISHRRGELESNPQILGWVLESPMTGYTEIFQETSKILHIPKFIQPLVLWRMMSQFNSLNHERPNLSELVETDSPNWGLTNEPTLLVQAADDERLGEIHYLRLQRSHDEAGTRHLLTTEVMDELRHSGCAVHNGRDAVVIQWLDQQSFHSSSD